MKNMIFAGATALIALAAAGAANAATADAGAGAKIIAPLEISRTADLYFGTIAPSTTVGDKVAVAADGSRVAVLAGGVVYESSDNGATFTQRVTGITGH
jgi:hypothetical protein